MNYSKGDWVYITDGDDRVDITSGKPYQVVRGMITSIEILDDANDTHAINTDHVELVTDDDEGDDDEASKANQRVTSEGQFNEGDTVMYQDGTPINTPTGYFTVVRSTATCVWFKETYSMPFNPLEFAL